MSPPHRRARRALDAVVVRVVPGRRPGRGEVLRHEEVGEEGGPTSPSGVRRGVHQQTSLWPLDQQYFGRAMEAV
jgi:hypothetical protein